jgi:hypothetical protein
MSCFGDLLYSTGKPTGLDYVIHHIAASGTYIEILQPPVTDTQMLDGSTAYWRQDKKSCFGVSLCIAHESVCPAFPCYHTKPVFLETQIPSSPVMTAFCLGIINAKSRITAAAPIPSHPAPNAFIPYQARAKQIKKREYTIAVANE